MRMSHVMLSKGFGGAERHFVDLTLEMAMRGHDVQAICHRDFNAASEFAGVANLCVEAIAVMGTWDIWAARRISRLISLFRSEVVHAHLARAAHLSARGAREQRIRLVTNTQVPITAIASTHRLATPANSLAASKSRWQIACTAWPRMAISSVKSTKCRSAPPKPFESITWLMRIVAYLAVCRPEGESAAEDHLIASNPPDGDAGNG